MASHVNYPPSIFIGHGDRSTGLSAEAYRVIAENYGTPVYVYRASQLEARAREALAMPSAFGHTVRYAMKALPNQTIVRLLSEVGLHIDASTGFEVWRALGAGVPAEKIQLTSQTLPADFKSILDQGVIFNACSLQQLRAFGMLRRGSEVSIRLNPGKGSGGNNRTTVGGKESGFGIWHGDIDELLKIASEYNLTITSVHSHIGSGSNHESWIECGELTLGFVMNRFPNAKRVSLGGGFKVARMPDEKGINLRDVGEAVRELLEEFARNTGRRLHLEIEPGTFLTANSGVLIGKVCEVKSTGPDGYTFAIANAGMTELIRPAMYGAQHPIHFVPHERGSRPYDKHGDVVVLGSCCETSDRLTTAEGDPENIGPRLMNIPKVGDLMIVGGVGAYVCSMGPSNYNSRVRAPEVLVVGNKCFLISAAQDLNGAYASDILLPTGVLNGRFYMA